MELSEYFRALRVRWRWVVAGLLIGVIGAGAVVLTTSPVYEASTELFVSTKQATDGTDLYSGSSFSQQRVKSYTEIVTTPRVLAPVIDRLGLSESPDRLAAMISVNAPVDTVLVDIAVRDTDAARAARIANAVSDSFVSVVGELERTANEPSPVRISSVRDATTPTSPVLPATAFDLAIGVLLGLIAGAVAAMVRHATDTVVRGERDLGEVLDTTILGEIPFDRQAADNPTLIRQPQGSRAEAFRALRTNLQFVEATGPLRSVVVTSSVPKEGKSTSAINLALSLVDSGMKVVVVDADLRRPRIAHYLGLIDTVGLTTVLVGRIDVSDALQRWGGGQLYVLTAGDIPPNPSELLGAPAMTELLRRLEDEFDLVILDAPPLLPVTDGALLSAKATGAVMVASSGRVRREQLARAVRSLDTAGARLLGVVLNLLPASPRASGGYYTSDVYAGTARWWQRLFRRPATRRPEQDNTTPEPATAS